MWGFLFAGLIRALTRRFSLGAATGLGWLAGFLLMWLVAWNLGVLPHAILPYAVPLSLIEVLLAALLCLKLDPPVT